MYLFAAVVFIGGYSAFALTRPLPMLQPVERSHKFEIQTATSRLVWPNAPQSAVGITGTDTLMSHGAQTPLPTASTAKIITALTVLQKKPLRPGQQGPTITLGDKDVALYYGYLLQDGSVVSLNSGEQINEYQMLEAVMLPSANNMADSLAIWAFGSLQAYRAAATQYVAGLGLKDTHIGTDASGLSPTTTSTAHDLVVLGEAAMSDPVLAQIVGQRTADDIPVVGTVRNVNFLLGTSGIVGLKTGNSDPAGGVYVSASRTIVNDRQITIVTALVGAPDLFSAMQGSLPLITSAQTNFNPNKLLSAGAIVGRYTKPWGGSVPATVSQDVTVSSWNGTKIPAEAVLWPVSASAVAGATVGHIGASGSSFSSSQNVDVKLAEAPSKPSVWWRLSHPF
jgi:D-alanyl-D-alanine carboxypeptidase (penicillin-binding protein 5/6)